MKKQIKIIILMLLLMNSKTVYSQVTQEWTSRYGQGFGGANAIATDNFGNVFVTGSDGNSPSNNDFVTIKYSTSGIQEWLTRFNGTANGSDVATSICLDMKGNIIVAGTSEGIGSAIDIVTVKYSPSGNQIWDNRYTSSGNNNDYGALALTDSLDNIYVTGFSNNHYVTIKYDSGGVQQWIDIYQHYSLLRSMTIDKLGNIYVTGESSGDSATSIDIVTIKYNSKGIRQWVSRFNSSYDENDYGLAIGVDSEGNVYVCGGSQGDLFYDDYITVKYDSSGVEQWNRRYNGSANFLDQARSLVIDNSNNLYITGYSTHMGTGYDFTTIKYNTNGDQLWITRYDNGLNDFASKMIIDPYGNLYVTGDSDGNGTGYDYATVKYDSLGQQQWVKRYDYSGQFHDHSTSIVFNKNGSVFVTGSSDRDFLTIKYSQLTGEETIFSEIPKDYSLNQNSPNPFNPKTVISYELRVTSFAKLVVYDVLGNEVATLVNENKPAGSYEVEFDGSNFSSGIYFYSLSINGNVIDTKRMVLLK